MVSVIVVYKNEENTIGRCIESILAQSQGDFELILVDDNSSDESPKIAARFRDPRIRLHRVNHNSIAKTRNSGLEKAGGEDIFFTDADCVVDGNWIRQGRTCLDKGFSVVEGRTIYANPRPTISDKLVQNHSGGTWMTCNVAYRAEAVRKAGGFRPAFGNIKEDKDLALRVLKDGRGFFNAEMIVHHLPKKWTYRTLMARHKDQAVAEVLLRKEEPSGFRRLRPFAPFHLGVIFFPPLVLVKGVRRQVRSVHDLKILLYFYPSYLLERYSLWKTGLKERTFVL